MDTKDVLSELDEEEVNQIIQSVLEDDSAEAQYIQRFLNLCEGELSVPTTCCYEVKTEAPFNGNDTRGVHTFLHGGLGVAVRYDSGWSLSFYGAIVSHQTCPSLFVKQGDVYYFDKTGGQTTCFAWGGGRGGHNRFKRQMGGENWTTFKARHHLPRQLTLDQFDGFVRHNNQPPAHPGLQQHNLIEHYRDLLHTYTQKLISQITMT